MSDDHKIYKCFNGRVSFPCRRGVGGLGKGIHPVLSEVGRGYPSSRPGVPLYRRGITPEQDLGGGVVPP